mgnify:FL=1
MNEKKKNDQPDERRRLFQLLAGGYLVYLAYQLISGAIKETSWTTLRIVGLASGIVFGGVGLFLLVKNLKAEADKMRKNDEPDTSGEGDEQ